MQIAPPLIAAPISVETSASADLNEVCRWLIESQGNPVRLRADDLPALGQGTRLRLALPMTGRRAVLCTLWLLEDVEAGACLLAGQLRFVAHPTRPHIKLTFSGHPETAMKLGALRRQADRAARQLVELIARLIERPTALDRLAPAPI